MIDKNKYYICSQLVKYSVITQFYEKISTLILSLTLSTTVFAQPPSDTSSKYPLGATYTHSSGTATTSGSYIDNVEVKGKRQDAKSYTLDGRRANENSKGIIISNGKKIFKK